MFTPGKILVDAITSSAFFFFLLVVKCLPLAKTGSLITLVRNLVVVFDVLYGQVT